MKKICLVREYGNGNYLDCYDEIEQTLKENSSNDLEVIKVNQSYTKILFFKVLNKLNLFKVVSFKKKYEISFSVLMGGGFEVLLPHTFLAKHNMLYMFDAWPRSLVTIKSHASFLNISTLFFSSNEITNIFNRDHSAVKAYWIPEGIRIDDYQFKPLHEKNIDVLEFGRKYDFYHNIIREVLEENHFVHLYERNKGEIVFKNRRQFIDGLSRSKISICIPSNVTHPERSEGISSMTLRYLQSMASKCLIVGIMPDEMRLLFNYCPIIPIDIENADVQIVKILNNYREYIPLIEKNYQEVRNNHTWSMRISKMMEVFSENIDGH